MDKIGFIGSGNIADALARGFLKVAAKEDIVVADAVPGKAEEFARRLGVKAASSNAEVLGAASLIVIAVKPSSCAGLLAEIGPVLGASGKKPLLVSVVAGWSIARLVAGLGGYDRLVRAMPNTPVACGQGMSALAPAPGASEADLAQVLSLFSTAGLAELVEERLFDAVTGLSGSGPAYGFAIIEALADGAVLEGMPRDKAYRFAAQTMLGAAAMVLAGGHPGTLKDMVASPGGTTIEGLRTLEAKGLRSALIEAVSAASRKSAALGK